MKKFSSAVLVIFCLFFVAACGGGGSGSNPTANSSTDTPSTGTPPTTSQPDTNTGTNTGTDTGTDTGTNTGTNTGTEVPTSTAWKTAGNVTAADYESDGNSYVVAKNGTAVNVAQFDSEGREVWKKTVLNGSDYLPKEIMASDSKIMMIALKAGASETSGDVIAVSMDKTGNNVASKTVLTIQNVLDATHTQSGIVAILAQNLNGTTSFMELDMDGNTTKLFIVNPIWNFQLSHLITDGNYIYAAGYQYSGFGETTLMVSMLDMNFTQLLYEPQRYLSATFAPFLPHDEYLGCAQSTGKFVVSGRLQNADGSFNSYLFNVSKSDGSWSKAVTLPANTRMFNVATDDAGNIYGVVYQSTSTYDLVKVSGGQLVKLASLTGEVTDLMVRGGKIFVLAANSPWRVLNTSGQQIN